MSLSSRTVVIFGGGVAGATLARRLGRDYQVTLVDPLDYFEVPMSAPRSLVAPDFAGPATIPFSAALPTVRHVRGRLIEWSPDGAKVQELDGRTSVLSGDVSVLATGSRFSNPLMRSEGGTLDERKAFYRRFHLRLLQARNVLIVGGGPIGIEVAGEISETFPDKRLTVLEAGPRILGGTSPKLAAYAQRVLAGRGVAVIVNERLVGRQPADDLFGPGGEATTDRGRTLSYDLLLWCIGGQPNTAFMRAQHPELLDSAGRIKVDRSLRVSGQRSVFAIGDITDLAENKMAWHVQGQVKVAEANIRSVLEGRSDRLKQYKPKTNDPTMVVTLGSRAGVAHLPGLGLVTAGWLNRLAKSAHMLVPKFRKALGVPKADVLTHETGNGQAAAAGDR
ncbi:NAD(P)/FAD-dependent oxidoreductase [Paraburkholderia mimosarum]|uniref:NAD(P)/FAD-dependent oxidoreductase n=1 Tax=Paraburkholderia mimosarum TaxID=312026 RepID=UPI0004160DC1|nr:FAD-dependent oxidoreductase [Paraburkholderia mimosarum]